MDCPHCSNENLLGAVVCAGCGASLRARPQVPADDQEYPKQGSARGTGLGSLYGVPNPAVRPSHYDANASQRGMPRPSQPGRRDSDRGSSRGSQPGPYESHRPTPRASTLGPRDSDRGKSRISSPGPNESHRGTTRSSQIGQILDPARDHVSTPVSHHGPSSSTAPEEIRCRACSEPFSWRLGDVQLCPSCRQCTGSRTGDGGMHSGPAASAFSPPVDRVKPRTGPVHVYKGPSPLVRGIAALVIGSVLVVSGFALVRFVNRKADPGGALVQNVRVDRAKLALAPPTDEVELIQATVKLHTTLTNGKLGFGTKPKLVDFVQSSRQTAEVSFVRSESRGAIVDVLVSCAPEEQSGRIQGNRDPRPKDIYPFAGHAGTLRFAMSADAAPSLVDGTTAVTGRDIPPLVTIGSVGAGARDITPGTRWNTEIELPATTDREARLFVERFPAEVTFVGRTNSRGFICAAMRIAATPPKAVPEGMAADYDRRSGKIAGVVLYELKTGLVIDGSLEVSQKFWRSSDESEEELLVEGRLELRHD